MTEKTAIDLRPAAEAAADWWAQFVSGSTGSRNAQLGGMGDVLTKLTETSVDEPDEKVQKFREHLVGQLIGAMERMREGGYEPSATVSTDYGPGWEIMEALDAAGIQSAAGFPWKTIMSVTPTFVGVAEGYGARMKAVWGERACSACVTIVERKKVTDEHGYERTETVYSEPTGKKVDYVPADYGNDVSLASAAYDLVVTDEPCLTCGGAKVLKAEKP